jgi:hypothetical protein
MRGQAVVGWLYNSAGSSVLIAGLFHAMHNAIVNSTGLVAIVGLPQFDVLMVMAGLVVLAAAIIAIATRGRLGLKRQSDSLPLDDHHGRVCDRSSVRCRASSDATRPLGQRRSR